MLRRAVRGVANARGRDFDPCKHSTSKSPRVHCPRFEDKWIFTNALRISQLRNAHRTCGWQTSSKQAPVWRQRGGPAAHETSPQYSPFHFSPRSRRLRALAASIYIMAQIIEICLNNSWFSWAILSRSGSGFAMPTNNSTNPVGSWL